MKIKENSKPDECFELDEHQCVALSHEFADDSELALETELLSVKLEQLRDTYSALNCNAEFDWTRVGGRRSTRLSRWLLTVMKVAAAVVIAVTVLALLSKLPKREGRKISERGNWQVAVVMPDLPNDIWGRALAMPGSMSMASSAVNNIKWSTDGENMKYFVPTFNPPAKLVEGGAQTRL
ncbi:MAG: hypothetical protein L3J71_15840 [Victivallaceae bacterium]|nr:hypothetical protein [Victivallaceae bacterium]